MRRGRKECGLLLYLGEGRVYDTGIGHISLRGTRTPAFGRDYASRYEDPPLGRPTCGLILQ